MRVLIADREVLHIGKQGENNAVTVQFPIADWIESYGNGIFQLIHMRSGDIAPYAIDVTSDDEYVYWVVSNSDVANPGIGECELVLVIDDTVAKSMTWTTRVLECVGEPGDAPDPWQSWIDDVLTAGADAKQAASDAKESEDESRKILKEIKKIVPDSVVTDSVVTDVKVNDKSIVDPDGVVNLPEWSTKPEKPGYTAAEVDAVPSNLGSSNKGKYLHVGDDGAVVPVNLEITSDVTDKVAEIEKLIPTQASSENQLADKAFVNSTVATNTANYISANGEPFKSITELNAYSGTLTNNDYAFVVGTDSQGNAEYTRYKYNSETGEWAEEYKLNNSKFTAAQWAAINSGITALLVKQIGDNSTAIEELLKSVGSLEDDTTQLKEDLSVLEQTVKGKYTKPASGIPASDLAAGVIPTIPSAVTEQTVAGWGFTKNTGTYTKPAGGIPASDLASGVIPTIPQKLPTPNKLTFTGAATGEFDGSSPLSIEIPQGGDGGGGTLRKIVDITLEQDVNVLEVIPGEMLPGLYLMDCYYTATAQNEKEEQAFVQMNCGASIVQVPNYYAIRTRGVIRSVNFIVVGTNTTIMYGGGYSLETAVKQSEPDSYCYGLKIVPFTATQYVATGTRIKVYAVLGEE